MKGAREFAVLFKTGQYGKLYITSGSHARGKTFRIQVLPEGQIARPNGDNNLCLNLEAVLVYGKVGGQPGWTEYYGWLHSGKWQEDFDVLANSARESREAQKKERKQSENDRAIAVKVREDLLLSKY